MQRVCSCAYIRLNNFAAHIHTSSDEFLGRYYDTSILFRHFGSAFHVFFTSLLYFRFTFVRLVCATRFLRDTEYKKKYTHTHTRTHSISRHFILLYDPIVYYVIFTPVERTLPKKWENGMKTKSKRMKRFICNKILVPF